MVAPMFICRTVKSVIVVVVVSFLALILMIFSDYLNTFICDVWSA
jgi:hypothetical protein